MTEAFKDLPALDGTAQEQAWLKERLETLSVREERVLAAALMQEPPKSVWGAVIHLQSLDSYEVCFPAGSYEQLGEFYLQKESSIPKEAMPYVDLERLGQQYEDTHPGLFIGNCYVAYPAPIDPQYIPVPRLEDNDWSVKLKLASPTVPEGVWLRLPDHDGNMAENSSEVALALDALRVNSLEDCTLLEARCILPEAGNLMEQYDSVADLVRDGDNLGYVLDEQGQGEAHWMEKFAAALEYEDCRSLRFALDISQNLHCYEWVSCEGLEDFAAQHLRSCGVKDELLQSGAIDLKRYAEDMLETSGYMQASGETGYLLRNSREFVRDFTAPEQGGMTMQ